MLEEYGVEVSTEGAVSPIVFGVRKGALPSNQKHAMEMQVLLRSLRMVSIMALQRK